MKFAKLCLTALTLTQMLTACGQTEIYYIYQQSNDPGLQQKSQSPNNLTQQSESSGQSQPQNNVQQNTKSPATSKNTTSKTTKPVTNSPTTAKPAATTALSVEDKLLVKARSSFDALQTLSATVKTYEKGAKGEGTGQIKFIFKKPGSVKVDVTNSPDPGQIGVKLSYSSGSEVRVRPTGALSLVSVGLSMDDPKLLSGRGYKLNNIDLSSIVERLTKPGTKAKLSGQTVVNGSKVVLLEIIPTQHFDSRITREILGIDLTTFMPRLHEMYEGTKKVYSVEVSTINMNKPLTADDFEV